MHTALRATSLTLANLLFEGFAADADLGPLFDPIQGGTMQVSLNTPEEMTNGNVQGLSVWLYRLLRDDQVLNAPLERLSPTEIRPTPLPVRLHYLVTPIVAIDQAHPRESPLREQTILGRAMQLLFEHPLLRDTDLQDDLTGTPAQIAVRLEPLSIEELTRVWSSLRRSYQLSVSYEASLAIIRPTTQPSRIAPVRLAMPEYAVIADRGRL